jgi:hypothetical protein
MNEITMRGTVATDLRIMRVNDKDYPICILMENTKERRGMSAAMNPQQAFEFASQLIEAAKRFGGTNG